METPNLEMLNAQPLLSDLLLKMQTFDFPEALFLNRPIKKDSISPILSERRINAFGIKELVLPNLLHVLGIRSLTINAGHDLARLDSLHIDIPADANPQYLWHFLKNDAVISELRLLFQDCRTIAFDEWSSLSGASDLWNGLLIDVIKPIGKKDLEFIFYLGDPEEKLSFLVDEALDIISDFSFHGQVTFALDEGEAIKLWRVLNGVHTESPFPSQGFSDLKRKYFSIFRTMSIKRLLIYSTTSAVLITNQEKFVLARQKVAASIELAADARQHFIEGFSIGLLLQLDMAHCLALGLIVFGSHGELRASPDKNALVDYLSRWIEDLQKPETMYLYQ